MLISGAEMATTCSLLTETHFAIVSASRTVAEMEDGLALLRAKHGELPHTFNFFSGPSHTGDIKLTMVLGAHGPYRMNLHLSRTYELLDASGYGRARQFE